MSANQTCGALYGGPASVGWPFSAETLRCLPVGALLHFGFTCSQSPNGGASPQVDSSCRWSLGPRRRAAHLRPSDQKPRILRGASRWRSRCAAPRGCRGNRSARRAWRRHLRRCAPWPPHRQRGNRHVRWGARWGDCPSGGYRLGLDGWSPALTVWFGGPRADRVRVASHSRGPYLLHGSIAGDLRHPASPAWLGGRTFRDLAGRVVERRDRVRIDASRSRGIR